MCKRGNNQMKNLVVFHHLQRMTVVGLTCLLIYWYMVKRMSNRNRRRHRIPLQRNIQDNEDRARSRQLVLKDIVGGVKCRELLRMCPSAFINLCGILQEKGGLRPTQRASVEEQVAKFLIIVSQNLRNRPTKTLFRRSGETVSRHFHRVLECIIELEELFFLQPNGSQTPPEIANSHRFFPYFKDCVGAIDGTHIRAKVPALFAKRYRGRKEYPTQNVLAACTFDLKFTYVLAGWEGTASDSRILKNALTRSYPLKIPPATMSKKPQEQFDDTMMAVKDELCVWTRAMDAALLDGLIEQSKLGNRVGGTFTTQAYDNLTAELKEKFPNKRLDKQKIVNHFKNMKKKFGPWYDIFKDGPSGFGYDPITGIWEAEPEVWEKLIEAKPEAAKYRNKAFPFYDKLAEIYGVDRAIGDRAETAAEMRAKKKVSQPQCVDSIEEIDLLVSQNEILLDNIATDSVNVSRQKTVKESAKGSASPLEASAEHCGAETSSKKAKTKSKLSDDEFEVLRNGFDTVANALMKSTAELVKPTRLVIEESDVWLLLEEIGLANDSIAEAYVYLVGNPDKLKALLASPDAKRKDVLKTMMRMSKATVSSYT